MNVETRKTDWDVVIVGAAFSGASLAVLLRREHPDLRVLVVDRLEKFDRKVGEATTEIAGHFLHKRLALTSYLANHHISKQGLRLWFCKEDGTSGFGDCAEVGADYQVRMPAFQLDRAELDEHLAELAVGEGATVRRGVKVGRIGLEAGEVDVAGERLSARWIVDASGRAAALSRQTGNFRKLDEHPTSAIWARFRNVDDLDGDRLRREFPEFGGSCQASRGAATNHLTGYGWWCWIIPLKGGDVSVGLVYDTRLFSPPRGGSLTERLLGHLLAHPVGRELFGKAEAIPGEARTYAGLPYWSEVIAGRNWQVVGDAAGFLDPLYSPGLDYCSWTVRCAFGRISRELRGERVDLDQLNSRWRSSYRAWFEALYRDKYFYIGDAELMSAAYLMDIGLFYLGPVREIVVAPEDDLDCLPFNGPVDRRVAKFMRFYNGRLAAIAKKRRAAGDYGKRNVGWRELGDGFVPDPRSLKPILTGVRRWLRAEWGALFLRAKTDSHVKPRGREERVAATEVVV